MKFLVDECVGSSVATFLKNKKHEVFSVFDDWRGANDDEILEKCFLENFIIITSDKDFGEMVYRQQKVHKGVILLRCEPNKFFKKIEVLEKLLHHYSNKLENNFVVVTNEKVRIIQQII
jgi:predicted nuclease of predicted toxin-antitoxin system